MAFLKKFDRMLSTSTVPRKMFYPITLIGHFKDKIEKSISRSELFNLMKDKYKLPVTGVRSNKNSFLVDLMFTNNLPPQNQIIPKIQSESHFHNIDLNLASKELYKQFSKSSKIDEIEIAKIKESMNKETMEFKIQQKSKLGVGHKSKPKSLSEILVKPELQFRITAKSPVRVYRNSWVRNGYDEPCYWTLVRVVYADPPKTRIKLALGVLTWRGKTDSQLKAVKGIQKKGWRHIEDPQTLSLDPRQDPFFEPRKNGPFQRSKFNYKIFHCVPKLPVWNAPEYNPKNRQKKRITKIVKSKKNRVENEERRKKELDEALAESYEIMEKSRKTNIPMAFKRE